MEPMGKTLTTEMSEKLKAPFANVSWRVQSVNKDTSKRSRVVAYVDARDVMDRLDEAVGVDGWHFDWEPVVVTNGKIMAAKGTLTICGVTRSDVGTASQFEEAKGAVSDALKRAAVHFGVARYLYDIGEQWAQLDQYKNITDADIARLNKIIEARVQGKPVPQNVSHQQDTSPAEKTYPIGSIRKTLNDHGYATIALQDAFLQKLFKTIPETFTHSQCAAIKAEFDKTNIPGKDS